MTTYLFHIYSSIAVKIEAEDVNEAREMLTKNPSLYADMMIKDVWISKGKEI